MKNKNKLPSVIVIMILSVVTVLTWVIFSVLREFTKSPSTVVLPELILPLDPRLDTNTINEIETRLSP